MEIKPPLGIMPRNIWEDKQREQRLADLFAAMERYSLAERTIPIEWINELKEYFEGSGQAHDRG